MLSPQSISVDVDMSDFIIRSPDIHFTLERNGYDIKEFIYREIPPNPFAPLVKKIIIESPARGLIPIRTHFPFTLTGIVSGPKGLKILLESSSQNLILGEGESYRQYKVVEISDKFAKITDEDNITYTLFLGDISEATIEISNGDRADLLRMDSNIAIVDRDREAYQATANADIIDTIVYITDTGERYHLGDCNYLRRSRHEISLSLAKERGYEPCTVCNPP